MNWGILGGGVNIFFRGQNVHQARLVKLKEPVFCIPDSRGFLHFHGFVVSASPAINPLACGCLSYPHCFRDSRRFS